VDSIATVVIRHCCSHSFSRCRSWVNVSKLRTGLGSRSCGTATKISVAPTSIPAALGSMQWRLGTAPPGPARFCFLLALAIHAFLLLDHGVGQVVFSLGISSSGSQLYRTTASPLFQSRSLGPSSGTGLKAPLHCRPTSHDHDGYEHTFRHTRFAAPPMPLVHCSFNPLKAGRWLGMTILFKPRDRRRVGKTPHW